MTGLSEAISRFFARIEDQWHRDQVEAIVADTTRELRDIGAKPAHIRESIAQLRRDLEVGR
ncbi:MAG: hypothetical protein AAGA93_00600 [Actinomycetota bacterium]